MTQKTFPTLYDAARYFKISHRSAVALHAAYGLPWNHSDGDLSGMRREAIKKRTSGWLLAACAVYWRQKDADGLEKLRILYEVWGDLMQHVESLNLKRFWLDVELAAPLTTLALLERAGTGDRAPLIAWVRRVLEGVSGPVHQNYITARLLAPLYGKPDLMIKGQRPSKFIASLFNSMIYKNELSGIAFKKDGQNYFQIEKEYDL